MTDTRAILKKIHDESMTELGSEVQSLEKCLDINIEDCRPIKKRVDTALTKHNITYRDYSAALQEKASAAQDHYHAALHEYISGDKFISVDKVKKIQSKYLSKKDLVVHERAKIEHSLSDHFAKLFSSCNKTGKYDCKEFGEISLVHGNLAHMFNKSSSEIGYTQLFGNSYEAELKMRKLSKW